MISSWMVLYCSVPTIVVAGVAVRVGVVSRQADRCPACGYELAGLATHRCPECGQIGAGRPRRSIVPRLLAAATIAFLPFTVYELASIACSNQAVANLWRDLASVFPLVDLVLLFVAPVVSLIHGLAAVLLLRNHRIRLWMWPAIAFAVAAADFQIVQHGFFSIVLAE